jgi:putative ABC transport system permease protein
VARRLARAFPESNAGRGVAIVPGTSMYQRDRNTTRSALALLLAVAGLVLVGACASTANLQLARALEQRREMGIRVALGAGRGRLLRQVFTENLLLTSVGGGLGLVLMAWASRLAGVVLPASLEPGTLQLRPDFGVFVFGVALTLLTGIGSVIIPAWWVARRDLTTALKQSAMQSVAWRAPMRNALVVGQVALSVLLLVAAGLLVRSLQQVLRRHSDLAANSVLVASVDVGPLGFAPAQGLRIIEAMRQRVLGLPGVQAAGFASVRPFRRTDGVATARAEGATEHEAMAAGETIVTPGFFSTLGIPLPEGRDFDAHDTPSSPPAAIVDEAMARRLWPGRSALGRRLMVAGKLGGRAFEVVGVVGDSRSGAVIAPAEPEIYLPYAQHYQPQMVLQVRAAGSAKPLIGEVRAAFASVEPSFPPFAMRTLAEDLEAQLQPERATASLATVFAALALVLAAVGIHGLVTWSVAQRTREFGVRLALGGRPADILSLVARQAGRLVLLGLGLGTLLSLLLTPLLRSRLVGVSFADPITYGCVLALLAFVGGVAGYLPARRATKVDPMEALRHE